MPAPLIWLGAGLAALYAGSKYEEHKRISRTSVTHYPGEGTDEVFPENGSIVCCGIFGVFDHTGIWVDGNIIELKGNGLIRGVSPDRFIDNRSGEDIYVACNERGDALFEHAAVDRATSKLYQFSDYDVIENNCHRFVWHCISGVNEPLTRFVDLNHQLSRHFSSRISWQPIAL